MTINRTTEDNNNNNNPICKAPECQIHQTFVYCRFAVPFQTESVINRGTYDETQYFAFGPEH